MGPIPYARPLLATEHTDFDVGAERIALALAAAWRIRLAAVIPMVSNAEYESIAPDVVDRDEAGVRARTIALGAEAAEAGIEVAIRVRRGQDPWREIVDEAQSVHADLIVVRRRGKRSFLAQLMIGEMVGALVRAAPCDVLMAPRAAQLWSRRVLAAVDGTTAAAAVARAAARVAHAAALPLTIATVAKRGGRAAAEAIVDSAVAVARDEGATAEGRVVEGQTAEAIVGLATASGADLIVAGRTARGLLHFGSTAQRIVGLASCAVLAAKP
jgi:nucleotide-binding universal stress UspA family protein